MDRTEAVKILEQQVVKLKTLPYATFQDWQHRRHIEVYDIKSSTGRHYKIEVHASIEDINKPNGNIRVIAMIDDSHLISQPTNSLIRTFLIATNNSTVAE
jgi:hypothetical protein